MADTVTPETAQIYSDLVKIGVPSVIALVGVVSSFVLAIKGYKKDLRIEEIRAEAETSKERRERKGELVKDITLGITTMHNSLMQYASLYAAKTTTEALNEKFPEKNRAQLSSFYQEFVDALHKGTEVKTKIYLLGNAQIIELFEDYWSSIVRFSSSYPPQEQDFENAADQRMIRLNEKQELLLKYLSKVYLLTEL